MSIEFQYFTSIATDERREGFWPRPTHTYNSEVAARLIDLAVADALEAEALGFERITIPEHHYSGGIANPIQVATYLAPQLQRAGLGVLGAVVPLHNPLRLAEDLAALDNLTRGNLRIGLLSGVPYEYLTYGTRPEEAREIYAEAVSLILRAWDEPYPFGWQGKHFQFRVASVWPRPFDDYLQRIVVSGTSPTSIEFAARNRLSLGISHLPFDRAAQVADTYRELAEQHGWVVGPENITYHTEVLVAETDAEAERLIEHYDLGSPPSGGLQPQVAHELFSRLGGSRGSHGNLVKYRGSVDTVIEQLQQTQQRIGFGALDVIFPKHKLPRDLGRETVQRFAEQIIPRFARDVTFASGH